MEEHDQQHANPQDDKVRLSGIYQPTGDDADVQPEALMTEIQQFPITARRNPTKNRSGRLQTVVQLRRAATADDEEVGYDDYKLPANLDHARIHGQVTRAGNYYCMFNLADPQVTQNLENYDELSMLPTKTCHCCNLTHIPGQLVPLSTRTHKMGALGTAVPGFFEFAKFSMLLYAGVLVCYSVYLIVKYSTDQKCQYGLNEHSPHVSSDRVACGDSWKFFFSSANGSLKKDDVIDRLLWLFTIVVMYCAKAFYYRKFRKIHSETDAANTDITDYTVEIRGLPKDICKKDIIDFFASQKLKDSSGTEVPIRVSLINFVFNDISSIHKMTQGLETFIENYLNKTSLKEIKRLERESLYTFDENAYIKSFDQEMDALEEEYKKVLTEQYRVSQERRKHLPKFTGNAYVSFLTMKEADLVLEHMAVTGPAKLVYKLFGGVRGCFKRAKGARRFRLPHQTDGYFYIEKAEFPQEIIFENLGYSGKNRLMRKALTTLLNLAFIVGTFFLIFVLKGVEFNLDEEASSTQIVSILITVVIKVVGFACTYASKALVEFGLPETTTERNIGIVWRITVSMFFNSAAVLVGANRYYRQQRMTQQLYLNVGLVNDLIMLLILSVLETGIGMMDPQLILNYLSRRKVEKDPEGTDLIQSKVNKFYEGGDFDYPVKFSKYLNLMMLTFFTIRMFPLAPFVAIIVAFCFYWSDKYYLLRLSKLPELCTVELPLSMLRFFDLALFVWSLAYAAVDDIKYQGISDWTFIMLIVTGANLVLNPNYLLRKLFTFPNNEGDEAKMEFQEMMLTLRPKSYFEVNPVEKLKLNLHLFSEEGFLAKMRLSRVRSKTKNALTKGIENLFDNIEKEMGGNKSFGSINPPMEVHMTNFAFDNPNATQPPTKEATLEVRDLEIDLPLRLPSSEVIDSRPLRPRLVSWRTPRDAAIDVPDEQNSRDANRYVSLGHTNLSKVSYPARS